MSNAHPATDPRVDKANVKVRSRWSWRMRLKNFLQACEHKKYRVIATEFPPVMVGKECRDCGQFFDVSFHETN